MQLMRTLGEEWRITKLGLSFDEPSYFIRSQWHFCHNYAFVLYRIAYATYVMTWCLLTLTRDLMTSHHYFVTQNNVMLLERGHSSSCLVVSFSLWAIVLFSLYTAVMAAATFYHHIVKSRHHRFLAAEDREVDFPMSISTEPIAIHADNDTEDCAMESETPEIPVATTSSLTSNDVTINVTAITDVEMITPWYLKVTWLLLNASFTLITLNSIFYWMKLSTDQVHLPNSIDNHNSSVLPLLCLLDLLLSKTPVRVLHGLYVHIVLVLYACVSILYSRYGSRDFQIDIASRDMSDVRAVNHCEVTLPYGPWTTEAQETAVSVGVALVVVPAVHLGWFCVYQARLYAWRRYGYCST